jgi:hypothetical protein
MKKQSFNKKLKGETLKFMRALLVNDDNCCLWQLEIVAKQAGINSIATA